MFSSIKEIDAPELARRLSERADDLHVIDVRHFGEVAAGTVPGATPVPLHTLPLNLEQLDRNKDIVLVCRSGARSAQAAHFLQQRGFANVYNLRGGMMRWAEHGLPAEAPALA